MAEPAPEPQGRLKCGERFLNSLLCASNDPNAPKKKWGKKCVECLKPMSDEPAPEGEDQAPQRESWGNRFTFFISTLGMSVGLGQVWRFPTLAYDQGGGAFLIMYGVLIFLFGNALFFFEISNGQYTGKNPLRVYDKVPLFIGIGWAMVSYSYLFCTYYSHMVAFGIYYIYRAITPRMPWSFCQEPDDLKDSYICVPYPKHRNPNLDGVICGEEAFTYNSSRLCSEPAYAKEQQTRCCGFLSVPADQCNSSHFDIEELCKPREFASAWFWNHVVNRVFREDDPNYGGLGDMNSWMLCCSFLSWLMAYLVLYKGIKSMGVLMYIMVPLPYIILIVMLGVVTPQKGATYGLVQFFTPDLYSFLDVSKWRIAAEQAFYSIGVAMGPLITFGSYTKFNSPSHIDGILICLCIFLTSVLCSSVVFSVLGMLSTKTGRPFNKVVEVGPGLVFIVYPESLELLPGAQFFSSLFYLMLINLGLSSVTGIIETTSSAIYDIWPKTRNYKFLVNLAVLFSAFLIGSPITLRGGLTVYNSFDTFSAGIPLVPICAFEMAIVVYIYGIGRFCEDINFMLGFYPYRYYRYQWLLGPFILTAIFIYGLVTLVPPIRLWSQILGWFLLFAVMGWIPIGMFYTIGTYTMQKKTCKDMFRPPPDHGPRNPADREARENFTVKKKIF